MDVALREPDDRVAARPPAQAPAVAADVTLQSPLIDTDRPVLISGIQAILRIVLDQARADRAAGLATAGLISGYRGSPLGGLDRTLWQEAALLAAHDIRFEPGLNEDLAATMLSGSQQLDLFPGKRVRGVFGLWYGKGPGVDRSADALRCANMLGTAKLGGVLAVAGDDHAAHSSTFPHQTEPVFRALLMPLLAPADAGEIVTLGRAGIALSRFSGLFVALKTTAETAEQTRRVILPAPLPFARPDLALPRHGLNLDAHLAWPAQRAELERRVVEERLPAARAWAQANALDRDVAGTPEAPVGIVTVGKAHHDLMHALRLMGLDGDPRIAIRKVALAWPLETEGMRRFAAGRRALLVVEEKASFVEAQLREALYNMPADRRPAIAGKTDPAGLPLVSEVGELAPAPLAAALARFLRGQGVPVADPPAPPAPEPVAGLLPRAPIFCAGCPHNSSTRLPEGSHAMAGIGCHIMALETTPATRGFCQMGGEGVPWVGLAPFTTVPHLFVNMGDGTWQHSGILAVRQALAAGTRVTFKILVNDAVAMTGGQPAEGAPTAAGIARQLAAEGVGRIALVADEASRLPQARALPAGTTRHTREALDAVQRELREWAGVSALVYDQVCAAEKRRRRKRGRMQPAATRVAINARVCENCGDCTTQSGCIAIEPVATEYGRKRRISPTACNTDLSCLKGFCPSFVTMPATAPAGDAPAEDAWAAREATLAAALPAPDLPRGTRVWRGLFAGIGGQGIVTTGAILAMAAHLEGRDASTLDFTGLAQKNGAVVAHVQIGAAPVADGVPVEVLRSAPIDVVRSAPIDVVRSAPIDVVRIPRGEADLLLAGDLAVGASADVLSRCRGDAAVIGNLDLQANLEFLAHADLPLDAARHRRAIERVADPQRTLCLHATALAERLFGSAQLANTLLLGAAWQRGLLPVGEAALRRAIALNGTAVALNHRAFLWGRILARHAALAAEILGEAPAAPRDLAALVEARAGELAAYQDEGLAARYRSLVAQAASREAAVGGAGGALARAVAEGFFHLLAVKDEYEVARLHAVQAWPRGARFHLAPPLLSRTDPATGRRRKVAVPGWLALPLFRALRHGKHLRGTALDPFGRQAERRLERRLAEEYEADLRRALDGLTAAHLPTAVALARLPLAIRGFGPVKQASAERAAAERRVLLDRLAAPAAMAAE